MQVQHLMTASPLTCGPRAMLADAAALMWQGDCGIVPVVDESNRVLGVITDRDICIATWSQNRTPSQIPVRELMHGEPVTCGPTDDVQMALRLMRDHRVHRLPVVNERGALEGVLSMNDIVLAAGETFDVNPAQVLDAFKGICSHPSSLVVA